MVNNQKVKRLVATFIFLAMLVGVFFWGFSSQSIDENLLLIHIQANSHSPSDSIVQSNVKREVLTFLSSFAGKSNAKEVSAILAKNISNICGIANEIVAQNNLDYKSSVSVNAKFFTAEPPLFKEGNYHFLSIILGRGDGEDEKILLHCSATQFQSRIF